MIPCEVCQQPATHCCGGLDAPMLHFCEQHGQEHARHCYDQLVKMGAEQRFATAPRELPRRCYLDLMVPAELAIRGAMEAVEAMPADVRLTDAVVLLGQAKDRVADYVDGVSRADEETPMSKRLDNLIIEREREDFANYRLALRVLAASFRTIPERKAAIRVRDDYEGAIEGHVGTLLAAVQHLGDALARAEGRQQATATRLQGVIESLVTQEPRQDCVRSLQRIVEELKAAEGHGPPIAPAEHALLTPEAEKHWRHMTENTAEVFGFTNREVRVLFAEIDRLRAYRPSPDGAPRP